MLFEGLSDAHPAKMGLGEELIHVLAALLRTIGAAGARAIIRSNRVVLILLGAKNQEHGVTHSEVSRMIYNRL